MACLTRLKVVTIRQSWCSSANASSKTCDKYVCTPCCVDDDGIDVCFSYPCCGNDVWECAYPPNCGVVPYLCAPNYANRDSP